MFAQRFPLTTQDPRQIGDVAIQARLGMGGMGVVYEGRHPSGRPVAVKVLRAEDWDSSDARKALAREATAMQRVLSPHVAQLLQCDLDTESPFIVMELVEGEPLNKVVPAGGFSNDDAVRIARQMLAGVAAAHSVHVIHQDLKPSNVLICDAGVKIIDFGIAAVAESSTKTALTLGTSGDGSGTMAWLSPEQIQGEPATEKSDIFAWGLVSAFAATGSNPFGTGRPEAVMFSIVNNEPNLSEVDPQLRDAISAALAKEPSERPTASSLLTQLTAPADQRPSPSSTKAHGTTPAVSGAAAESTRNWKPWVGGAAAGVLIALGVGAAMTAASSGSEEPTAEATSPPGGTTSTGPRVVDSTRPGVIPNPTVAIGETFSFSSGMECRIKGLRYGSVKKTGARTLTGRIYMRNAGTYAGNSCDPRRAWDSQGVTFRPDVDTVTVRPGRGESDYFTYEVAGDTQIVRIEFASHRANGGELAVLDVPPPS